MKSYICISIFLVTINLFAQEIKEPVYLFFDSSSKETFREKTLYYLDRNDEEQDGYIMIKKYRKEVSKEKTIFYIFNSMFFLDKKNKIDTCDVSFLNKVKFDTPKVVDAKIRFLVETFMMDLVFKKTYLIEPYKDKVIKYPVHWFLNINVSVE